MVVKLRFNPKSMLSKIFPISAWGRTYNCETAVCDLVAGFTVALTLVPQSIAYASLAGLEPQYGLYASFAGSLVYVFLGTCPQINVGPTALLSLLTFTYTHDTNPDFAVLLCFLGGFVQLFAGVAQLGFLVDFVSLPVVSGFTSASALIIACSQVKGLLGLSFNAETFVDTWKGLFRHIRKVKMADSLLSLGCCALLISMEQLKRIKLSPGRDKKSENRQKILSKMIWFVGVGRNATVVVFGALVAAFVHREGANPFKLTGQIRPGLPEVGVPDFSSTVGNTTYHFADMVGHMGTGVLVVPLIGIIANVAIAKAFAAGRVVDATQEIVALGACNVVGAFFRSFPVNGSFTRSAVSKASGVRTPGAGLYTGIIVLLTLSLLTPYFFFIPKAALSSVIICAVLHMVDVNIVKSLWNNSRLDLVPLFATFLSGLFLGIELGILVGVSVDLAILLYFNARPDFNIKIVLDTVTEPFYLVTPTGRLAFPSAAYLREKLNSVHMDPELENPAEKPRPVVMDCGTLHRADWTAVQAVKSLAYDFKKNDRTLIFLDLKEPVFTKLKVQLGDEFLHASSPVELDELLAESKSKRDALAQSNEIDDNNSIPEIKLDKLSPEEVQ